MLYKRRKFKISFESNLNINFSEGKMAVNNFLLKKFQKMDELYVIFCNTTHLPYVECDAETYDDQIFAFTKEEKVKEMMKSYEEKKLILGYAKIAKAHILPFIVGLYAYGINRLVLCEDDKVYIELEQLADKPDIDKLKNDKIPRINPELQLSSIYFLQNVRRRNIERTRDDQIELHNQEEEMAINLFRTRFIIGIDLTANGGKLDKDHPNFKLPFAKLPNGKTYTPCFTDFSEYQKFAMKNKDLKLSLITVKYDDLEKFTKQTEGIVLNPAGFNLILSVKLLDALKKNYGA